MRKTRASAAARALAWAWAWAPVLLLAAAGAAGQHAEDRPLPASPCPDVFTYEGSTVDWDRWYGVVLVATDIPLTGLRVDVWLSRPALALRHDWDGNVTTLDNKRFTILNLYKRIEPGPPKSVRIVVKFDENEEIPVVRAIELNGRRICSGRSDSQTYDVNRRQPSRHRPEYEPDEELPPQHSSPSNSKYNFDRTTPRTPSPPSSDSHSSYDHDKNTVSRKPTSTDSDPVYERNTPRPAYSDDKYSQTNNEYHTPPSSHHQDNRRPVYEDEPETYTKKANQQHSTAAPRRPVESHDNTPPGHRKPSSGSEEKLHADTSRSSGAPGRTGNLPPGQGGPVPGQGRYKTTRRPEDDSRKHTMESPPRRTSYEEEPRQPMYADPQNPEEEDTIKYAEEHRSRPTGHSGRRKPTTDPPIDIRFDAQPLSDDRDSTGLYSQEMGGESERPLRQPTHPNSNTNNNDNGNRRPAQGDRLPPGLEKHGAAGPPGLGGNLPPGHGGPVPGHNKANKNGNNNNNNNNNGGWQPTTEADRWSSTFSPDQNPQRPHPGSDGDNACGRTLTVAPLITYGHNTSRGQWPWHTALYQVKGVDLKYICGGTLISPNFIVTAAHCVTRSTTGRAVDPDTIIAYLGKYHLHRWTNEEGVQQGKVAAIHVHPDYNTTNFRSDVALLELATQLSYTQYVRHVCLWGRDESSNLDYIVNQDGYVVGWGYDENGDLTEELRMATMPIVAEQTCLRSYPEFYSRFSNERTFCAGHKNGTSACNGDSGGGFFLPRMRSGTKTWYLRGLVSVSVSRDDERVCNTDHYVVFTDLAKYRDWITNAIR